MMRLKCVAELPEGKGQLTPAVEEQARLVAVQVADGGELAVSPLLALS
jgi:hypothetical protein